MQPLTDELAFAADLAREAGRRLMARYERLEHIAFKGVRDIVTEADHESESLIIAAIHARSPGDGILAEESGGIRGHAGTGSDPVSEGGRTWVIDPLDGTVNYANGIPFFCVSLALCVDGHPVLGVIHDPARDETYAAAAGGSATLNGVPVGPSRKHELAGCVISMALGGRGGAARDRILRRRIRRGRTTGSSALAIAYVANGRFDAFVQTRGLSAWDIAAAGLIAQAAGATVTSSTGGPWFDVARPTREASILAAPPALHVQLLPLVG